ncbi:MAG: hypothetical protein ACXV5F_03190 [Halobacteriota archaeon]
MPLYIISGIVGGSVAFAVLILAGTALKRGMYLPGDSGARAVVAAIVQLSLSERNGVIPIKSIIHTASSTSERYVTFYLSSYATAEDTYNKDV